MLHIFVSILYKKIIEIFIKMREIWNFQSCVWNGHIKDKTLKHDISGMESISGVILSVLLLYNIKTAIRQFDANHLYMFHVKNVE